MKHLTIYIAVMSALLLIALGLGVYVWYTVQTVNRDLDTVYRALEEKTTERAVTPVSTSTAADSQTGTTPTSTDENMIIPADSLTTDQQMVLKAFGSGDAALVITPEMVSCAHAAVGETRLAEILEGSAPSPLESARLLPCIKK